MMMQRTLLLSLWLALLIPETGYAQRQFRMAELNVENLFDCKHEPGKDDTEFLPDAERHWTQGRYWRKLQSLSKVLIALGGDVPVDVVALCEVENDSVLYDLTKRAPLRNVGYEYVVTSSADPRGMDVALLYQPASFRPVGWKTLNVSTTVAGVPRPTRDILHVSGLLQTGDTLDVFVCHFPSRRGGSHFSKPYRLHAARVLRAAIDSVIVRRRNPQVVALGDFNDTPADDALRRVLRAQPLQKQPLKPAIQDLYNLTTKKRGTFHPEVKGTYFYSRRWEQLDQVVVNGLLLDETNGIHTHCDRCQIMDFPFLMTTDKQGNLQPFRTYQGPIYRGGWSDHLPLTLTFSYSW